MTGRNHRRRLPTVEEASAGGLVVNAELKVPVIGRLNRRGLLLWSLPKGHIEPGETPEDAAVREIEEETGILGRVVATLGTIDFWFQVEAHRVHKTVQHYLLEYVGGDLCCDDHEVAVVAWVPLNELESRLAYPDERGVVVRATATLHEGLYGGRRL